jgi:hypothetical protein
MDDAVEYGADDIVGFLQWKSQWLGKLLRSDRPWSLAHHRGITKEVSQRYVALGRRQRQEVGHS